MSKYNFFISYTPRDGSNVARNLYQELTKQGYSAFIDVNNLEPGVVWEKQIKDAIIDCDCFVPIITPEYINSKYACEELMVAINAARDRAKDIIAVVVGDEEMTAGFNAKINIQQSFSTNGDDDQIADIAEKICKLSGYKIESALLYEKLNAFTKIKNHDKAAETVCQIFTLIKNNYEELTRSKKQRIALYKEIYKLYEVLYKYGGGSYSKEAGRVVRIIMPTLSEIQSTLFHEAYENDQSIFLTDLYCISFAIRVNKLVMEIRNDCVDTWTTGDVMISQKIEDYIGYQEKYLQAYLHYIDNLEDYASSGQYSEEDVQFIKDTNEYILSKKIDIEATQPIKQKDETANATNLSEDEQILISIANFTKEGNRLFNLLRKKGIAGDFLRCLLTSYERLKNYCEIVGAQQIISECVEQIAEIRTEMSMTGTNPGNELAEKGIKSLLGITIAGAGNYDVFISYKSQDEDLGKVIYDFFRKNMKEPFWSKVSLPELSESEYENAIYDALDKAKHFVVVLSNLSYMKDSWVEREMRIFHREKNENRKDKDSNFVFVVTDDLYKQIINSNKTLIPIEYRGYQIIKMSEYQDSLLQYIK